MIEQDIAELKQQVQELREQIQQLKKPEEWVTASQLAKILGCSRNNVYVKIRKGEIQASRLMGDPRIPMSQFYGSGIGESEGAGAGETVKKPCKEKKILSMKERIFAEA